MSECVGHDSARAGLQLKSSLATTDFRTKAAKSST